MFTEDLTARWDEDTSQKFLDYGRYFVPEREFQMGIMVSLLEVLPMPCRILELCCGEGLLAEQILDKLPGASYLGMDGSQLMLEHAQQRLSRFGDRASLNRFDLTDRIRLGLGYTVQAVVSSLAIHHLYGKAKQQLFNDVFSVLEPGGCIIIADVVDPATLAGRKLAGAALDKEVRERALEQDGNMEAFNYFQKHGWNMFYFLEPDDIDHPNRLFDQLAWLSEAGFVDIDVHYFKAGHALFSAWKAANKGEAG